MTADIHPTSWSRAVDELADPAAVAVAGGTGVQPWLTTTGDTPSALVHLRDIREAWDVETTTDGLRLGAMVAVGHSAFDAWFGDDGAGWFATPAVRRRATVVGNLVSRLGPRELGPVLIAAGAQIRTWSSAAEPGWRSAEHVLREGLPNGALAMQVELCRPERISYRRVSPRSRMSRVEVGLCAAIGPGCGAALMAETGGHAHRVDDADAGLARPNGRADFVASVRHGLAAAFSSNDIGDELMTMVTALAERVHDDLHHGKSL